MIIHSFFFGSRKILDDSYVIVALAISRICERTPAIFHVPRH